MALPLEKLARRHSENVEVGEFNTSGGKIVIVPADDETPIPQEQTAQSRATLEIQSTGESIRGRWWLTRQMCSIAWALVPIGTLGIGTPIVSMVAPMRVRTKTSFMTAGIVTGFWALGMVGIALTTSKQDANTVSVVPVLIAGCGAVGYGFWTRNQVFGFTEDAERKAGSVAAQRLKHRDTARKLILRDPRMAHELGIGRPDLTRSYDDGGLIDVNHVPLETLESAGIENLLAEQIIDVRAKIGGFESLNDLEVNMDLTPQQMDSLADILIFLR
jgi:hypothetical protein